MADTQSLGAEEATTENNQRERSPGTGVPRWVKAFLVVGLAVVLLFAIGKLTGLGGDHGPGRHGGDTPSPVIDTDDGHRPHGDHGPQRASR